MHQEGLKDVSNHGSNRTYNSSLASLLELVVVMLPSSTVWLSPGIRSLHKKYHTSMVRDRSLHTCAAKLALAVSSKLLVSGWC
jgi:hypothetical protein